MQERGRKMYAVEFRTQITNGHICVPEDLLAELRGHVRVIVLLDEEPAPEISDGSSGKKAMLDSSQPEREKGEDFLTYRMRNPYVIPDFKPLTREQIYERRPDYE